MRYKVIVNEKIVYVGGRLTANNRFRHEVAEDWKDESDIVLLREDGYMVERCKNGLGE